jgi:hypothetical protein
MRFDIHLRNCVRQRLSDLSLQMAEWEVQAASSEDLFNRLVKTIQPFRHTTQCEDQVVGGVDGSGEFPVVAYGDSFVYTSVSAGALYKTDPIHGLREIPTTFGTIVEFTWLTGAELQRKGALLETFGRLTGHIVEEVIERSDYLALRPAGRVSTESVRDDLIVPPAHDVGNVGLQLRTTAELASALRLIEESPPGTVVLTDGTMTLPFARRKRQSLFFEHLRRFCCVRARERGVIFGALSKSHGLPSGLRIEEAARDKLGQQNAEHWYMRMPDRDIDGWSPTPIDGPGVPPVGAITYLVRLHRNTPIMRLDLDAHRRNEVYSASDEQRLFQILDYASHDQRSFGYPYPITAAHDRASLSQQERVALRKQVIDAAVSAGMRRTLFRDAAQATGHA